MPSAGVAGWLFWLLTALLIALMPQGAWPANAIAATENAAGVGNRSPRQPLDAGATLAVVVQADPTQDSEATDQEETQPRAEEQVTVTATRLPSQITDIPASVRTISRTQLAEGSGLLLDEALRALPEFSLFRRTPSRSAHPTSQGINLRGVAPSGVSRALVLVDGVPLNDAFGGWVYWDRVPLLALDHVEVALGGGSAPFGNHALGGVVQIVTRRAEHSELTLQALVGSDSTFRGGMNLGIAGQGIGLLATLQAFDTGGYFAVPEDRRGAIDRRLGSAHRAARLRLDVADLAIVMDGLWEERDNGTPAQTNDTQGYGMAIHWQPGSKSNELRWQINAHARHQDFHSRFSSVAADRSRETPVLDQQVPSDDFGLGGFSWVALGDRALLSSGLDWRRVRGHSLEDVLLAGFQRRPGGTQNLGGLFATLQWSPGSRWTADLSLRADGWHQRSNVADAMARDGLTLSPRAGLVWHAGGGWALRAAGYRAFRAPTLNELYRQFRVGNVLTTANAELEAEHLTGFEAGVNWEGRPDSDSDLRIRFDATLYTNALDGAIVNATLSSDSSLVRRQRRNLGEATARGFELNVGVSPSSAWHIDAGLVVLGSRIDAEPIVEAIDPDAAAPEPIVGNRLPQVPRHRGRLMVRYAAPNGWSVLASMNALGKQFEDDRNRLPLAAAVTGDLALRGPLTSRIYLALKAQNLFDHQVEVGRTPILSFGPPRAIAAMLEFGVPLGDR